MFSKRILEKRKRIINLYIIEKKTVKQIASICHISATTVYCILKASNVRMRKRKEYTNQTQRKRISSKFSEEECKNLLIYLYQVLKFKRRDLALLLSTSISKVDKLLKKYEIKRK